MKKSRVNSVIAVTWNFKNNYYQSIPLDKKGRTIPSSVDCWFNAAFFTKEEVELMTKVI